MADFLQETDELHVLVRIFLAFFVLIALFPYFSKRLSQFLNYFSSLRRSNMPGMAASISGQKNGGSPPSSRMTDVEYLVFTRLAQTGTRGISPAELARRLHMDRVLVQRTLHAVNQRGLIRLAPSFGLGRRLTLSKKGHAQAISEGLIPQLQHACSRDLSR